MDIFIRAPWLAFVVGAIFFALSGPTRSKLLITISTAWILYGVYEYLMRFRVLCSGECNIRVDLLLIYPLLLILSIIAVVTLVKRPRQ